jgi:hypothetical protein
MQEAYSWWMCQIDQEMRFGEIAGLLGEITVNFGEINGIFGEKTFGFGEIIKTDSY